MNPDDDSVYKHDFLEKLLVLQNANPQYVSRTVTSKEFRLGMLRGIQEFSIEGSNKKGDYSSRGIRWHQCQATVAYESDPIFNERLGLGAVGIRYQKKKWIYSYVSANWGTLSQQLMNFASGTKTPGRSLAFSRIFSNSFALIHP